VTTLLRHFEPPAVVTVIIVAVCAAAIGLALILAAPATFLGADGQWMLGTLMTSLRRLRPVRVAAPVAVVTAE
jgi:hypothetical protein